MSEARGIAMGIAAFLCWGLLTPGNEILLRELTPLWMQAVRSFLASLALALWIGPSGIRASIEVFRHKRLMIAAFFGTFVSFALYVLAQDRLDATFTTLGFYTAPMWTAILAHRWLGERVGPWFPPALAAMGLGAWLALTSGGALAWPDAIGMALATGAGLSWAVFSVMLRRSSADVDWKSLLFASTAVTLPLFVVLAAVFEPAIDPLAWSPTTWRWTFIQAAIPTLLAMGLFQVSLRHAPAGHINLLVGIELAGTVFFAWLLLGDTFQAPQLLGLALVLLAVTAYLWTRAGPPNHRHTL